MAERVGWAAALARGVAAAAQSLKGCQHPRHSHSCILTPTHPIHSVCPLQPDDIPDAIPGSTAVAVRSFSAPSNGGGGGGAAPAPGASSGGCPDTAPPGGFSCAQQKAWGKVRCSRWVPLRSLLF